MVKVRLISIDCVRRFFGGFAGDGDEFGAGKVDEHRIVASDRIQPQGC